MNASILICITLACFVVNVVRAEENALENKFFYGHVFRLPGIYRPPPPPAGAQCRNDKMGCPAGQNCVAATSAPVATAKCSVAATQTACATPASCPATCTSAQCRVCAVTCN